MDNVKISIPIDRNERDGWRAHAKAKGFNGKLATYIKWLVRQDMKSQNTPVEEDHS